MPHSEPIRESCARTEPRLWADYARREGRLTRYCSACGSRFEPSEWDDRYCSAHCILSDLGEPCGDGCVRCEGEGARAAVDALARAALAKWPEVTT